MCMVRVLWFISPFCHECHKGNSKVTRSLRCKPQNRAFSTTITMENVRRISRNSRPQSSPENTTSMGSPIFWGNFEGFARTTSRRQITPRLSGGGCSPERTALPAPLLSGVNTGISGAFADTNDLTRPSIPLNTGIFLHFSVNWSPQEQGF
jgi:hypothetical protein